MCRLLSNMHGWKPWFNHAERTRQVRVYPGLRFTGLSRATAGLKPQLTSAVSNGDSNRAYPRDAVYSHVIAADGKWSAVRDAAAALETLQSRGAAPRLGSSLSWSVEYEQTWGVQMQLDEALAGEEILDGFRCDASHIVYPKTLQGAIYALVMPLQDGAYAGAGAKLRTSVSIVCSDLLLEKHPWAAPLEARQCGEESWSAAAESHEVNQKFARLVAEEFPQVCPRAHARTAAWIAHRAGSPPSRHDTSGRGSSSERARRAPPVMLTLRVSWPLLL